MTINTLDKIVRRIINKRDSRCFTCGRTDMQLEVGHFVPRRYKAVRWDLRNCHLQCIECNRYKSGNLKKYKENLGDIADELWNLARSNKKVDLDDVYNYLLEQERIINEMV